MQVIKRLALALAFILALLPMTGAAEDDWDYADEEGVFGQVEEQPTIPEGVNQGFILLECGKIIMIGVAIFEGPDNLKGQLIVMPRLPEMPPEQADAIMEEIYYEAVTKYKTNGPVIRLEDITNRLCV